jgi:hypothetical protein
MCQNGRVQSPERCIMACNNLRIDLGDGSSVVDYRIENDCVETRTLEAENEKPWQRLTPEQLTSQVMADTVVARWLRRRMGVHRLLRACTHSLSYAVNSVKDSSDRTAA